MNQKSMIIDYIARNGSITPMQAIYELGCTKLATRIGELTAEGYRFTKEFVRSTNRYGKPCSFMKYSMAPDNLKEEA